ncbi:MAG: biopolymer transporter ExbD [Marinobacter sp.]|uniref:ExbD/TolR family protein n=1 Tax=Marinobacter sp. TaxID=50741 RepID=UPI0034A08079
MQLVSPRPSRPMPIRITPLIDVVFILLVFFMLTTRLLPTEHLELENSTASRGTTQGEPHPLVILESSGELSWNDQRWQLQELVSALQAASIRELNLKADGDASLAGFTTSLSELNGAGFKVRWQRTSAETGGD